MNNKLKASEAEFKAYLKVQFMGQYNMATDSCFAMRSMGFNPTDEVQADKYFDIVFHYSDYTRAFPTARSDVRKEINQKVIPTLPAKPKKSVQASNDVNRIEIPIPETIYLIYIRKPNSKKLDLRDWRVGSDIMTNEEQAINVLNAIVQSDTSFGCRNERKEFRLVKFGKDQSDVAVRVIENKVLIESR